MSLFRYVALLNGSTSLDGWARCRSAFDVTLPFFLFLMTEDLLVERELRLRHFDTSGRTFVTEFGRDSARLRSTTPLFRFVAFCNYSGFTLALNKLLKYH